MTDRKPRTRKPPTLHQLAQQIVRDHLRDACTFPAIVAGSELVTLTQAVRASHADVWTDEEEERAYRDLQEALPASTHERLREYANAMNDVFAVEAESTYLLGVEVGRQLVGDTR